MKTVGIITFHSAHNYGAMLQVYALQQCISKYQFDVTVIDYRNDEIDKQYKLIKIDKSNIKSKLKSIGSNLILYKKNKKRYDTFNKFMNENLKLSNTYNGIDMLKENSPRYDIYITGSDQVWNYNIVGELSDAYTLNFGNESVKRISYAASIGDNNLVKKHKDDYRNKLQILDYISVRELDGKKALENVIDKSVEVVLDPTLLLDKKEWDSKLISNNGIGEKYILAYVVEHNEEYINIVNYLSKLTGYKVVYFEKRNKYYENPLKSAYTEGPFEFVNLIKNATYVIATSFHATVFSILFNKKFFVVPHVKTGARVTNLLERLNIEGRDVNSLEEFKNKDYNEEIDYNEVEEILNQERDKSIKWLKEAIEN